MSPTPVRPWHEVNEGAGHEWSALCRVGLDELHAAATPEGGCLVEARAPSLDEIFVAHVGPKTLNPIEK